METRRQYLERHIRTIRENLRTNDDSLKNKKIDRATYMFRKRDANQALQELQQALAEEKRKENSETPGKG